MKIDFQCAIYDLSVIVEWGEGGRKNAVWACKGLTEFQQKLKALSGKPVPELFLKG